MAPSQFTQQSFLTCVLCICRRGSFFSTCSMAASTRIRIPNLVTPQPIKNNPRSWSCYSFLNAGIALMLLPLPTTSTYQGIRLSLQKWHRRFDIKKGMKKLSQNGFQSRVYISSGHATYTGNFRLSTYHGRNFSIFLNI